MPDDRETLGRIVRETWVAWAKEQPDPKGSWLTGWDELDGGQREVDMRIGEAVAAAVREYLAACMDELAANYPEAVFPSRSVSIDGISGTAMRLAYSYAARYIREGHDDA